MATEHGRIVEQLLGGADRERKERVVVTEIERQSLLWAKLTEHMEKRIALLRAKNDNDRDAVETAKLRGRIAELKILLALDKPAPAVAADDSE